MNEIKTLEEFGALCAKVAENTKKSNWDIVTHSVSKDLAQVLIADANAVIKVTFQGKEYSVRRNRTAKATSISTLTVGTCLVDHVNPVTKAEWKAGNMFYSWE